MKINRICISLMLAGIVFANSAPASADSYYDRKVSLYELLPIGEDDIVFVGNSITDGGELNELLGMPNIKNRGITSDVITGVEKRINQVMKGHPKKVFLLIGGNDLSHKLTAAQIAERYERLVKKMRALSPATHVYLQSIMPINNDFGRYKTMYGAEKVIPEVNRRIKEIAVRNGCTYIDLTDALQDPKTGKLKKAYTNDGLHLTGAGYKAWMSVVEPYVKAEGWPLLNK